MKIAVGNSRMDKKWKNREISWEELCQRVSVTIRTTETVEEYRKLKKGSQDSIKDVGGFVGGALREGRRKNGTVLCRSMLTLDMDYGSPDIWDTIELLHDFRCCVYSTHKHTPEHPRLRMLQTQPAVNCSTLLILSVSTVSVIWTKRPPPIHPLENSHPTPP